MKKTEKNKKISYFISLVCVLLLVSSAAFAVNLPRKISQNDGDYYIVQINAQYPYPQVRQHLIQSGARIVHGCQDILLIALEKGVSVDARQIEAQAPYVKQFINCSDISKVSARLAEIKNSAVRQWADQLPHCIANDNKRTVPVRKSYDAHGFLAADFKLPTIQDTLQAVNRAGSISGRVTTESNQAIDNVQVRLVDAYNQWNTIAAVFTDINGNFQLTEIADGEYRIFFHYNGYFAGEWYNNQGFNFHQAQIISIQEGNQLTGINAKLAESGAVSGRVIRESNQQGLKNCQIDAYDWNWNWQINGLSNTNGDYQVYGLPAGNYKICFRPANGDPYVTEWYDNQLIDWNAKMVLVSAGQTTANINASLATAGSISGRVTDEAQLGLSNIHVSAILDNHYYLQDAWTDADGYYQIDHLPAGNVKVAFLPYDSNMNYAFCYYQQKSLFSNADFVMVTAGSITQDINAQLSAGGSISGYIKNSGGQGLYNARIDIHDMDGHGFHCVWTDENGNYTITGLPTAAFKLRFEASSAGNYVTEWFDNQKNFDTATVVNAVAGTTVSGVDAVLADGASISGKVMNENLIGLGNINVNIHDSNNQWLNGCQTNYLGDYLIIGLAEAADYRIHFNADQAAGNYISEWYNNKEFFEQADPVAVTSGNLTANINAVLVQGGAISGRVTDESETFGIYNVNVQLHDLNGQHRMTAYSDMNGYYVLQNIPAGSYKVKFETSNVSESYVSEWYNNKTDFNQADTLTVTAGQELINITGQLAEGGIISGRVTDESGTLGIANISVHVRDLNNNHINGNGTDSNGFYTVRGIPAGDFKVEFWTNNVSGNYISEWYNNKPDFNQADILTITVGQELTDINAQLAQGGAVSGRVTDESGTLGIANISIHIRDLNNYHLAGSNTDSNGYYTVHGAPAGDFKVEFWTNNVPGNYVSEYYNNKPDFEQADILTVNAGQELTGINAQLGTGGAISGRVTDESGSVGLANISIHIRDLNNNHITGNGTDSNGYYSVHGIPAGDFKVEFWTGNTSGNYLAEYYNNQPDFEQADILTVNAGQELTGINAQLGTGGAISGRVTDETGTIGIQNVHIHVQDMNDKSIGWGSTDSNGDYIARGIPVGTCKVRFWANQTQGYYITEWYNDQPDFNQADTLTVTAGQELTAINGRLAQGGALSGRVTDSSSNGLSGIQVNLYTLDHQSNFGCGTDSNGNYTLSGIPAGSYKVLFNADYCGQLLHSEWYDNQTKFADAAEITIAPGAMVTGINAQLAAITDDSFDPNNEFAQAAEVTVGVYNNLMMLEPGVDQDWYKLYIDESYAGKDLKIQFTVTSPFPDPLPSWWNPNSSDIDFHVLDENHHPLGCVYSSSDDETLYLSNLKPGWIYICLNYSYGYYGPEGTFSGSQYSMLLQQGDAQSFGIGYSSGRVTDELGQGIPYLVISMRHYPHDHAIPWPVISTDADGNFTIGYTPGNYNHYFNDNTFNIIDPAITIPNYVSEYYHDVPYGAGNSVNWFAIQSGQTVTIDESLQTGGTITGRVTNEQGLGVITSVYAYSLDGYQVCAGVLTDANGYYTLPRVTPGKVRLMQGRNAGNWKFTWYPDQTEFNQGQEVTVVAGQTTTDINWTATAGGQITGKVTDEVGNPIANVQVAFFFKNWDDVYRYTANTNANGIYTIRGLPTHSYYLFFLSNSAVASYSPMYYGNTLDLDQAAAVPVTAGQITTGIDMVLPAGGLISGRVVNDTGNPVANMRVQVYHAFDHLYVGGSSVMTNANGEYTIAKSPVGPHKLFICDLFKTTGYVNQFYLGKDSLTTANSLDVQANQTIMANDVVLYAGGASLSGKITFVNGNEVGFPLVYLYDADSKSQLQYAYGEMNGNYQFKGIPPGNYKVLVSYRNILPSEWYGDVFDFSATKSLTIAANASITLNMVLGGPDVDRADSIVAVFSDGLWHITYDQGTVNSSKWSSLKPDMIRMGDMDGNGFDDLACWFKTDSTFWVRYDSGQWVKVPASAADMICFDLGDLNKDGKADIVGSWTFGTWWKNTATGVWAKLSNMSPTYLAAGDFDGDGADDMVGLYPSLSSLWIYAQNASPQWRQISKQINLNNLRCGDFDNDGKADVLGSWDIGTWSFNPTTNVWTKHSAKQASTLCAGDINNLKQDDIIGDWSPDVSGLWTKLMESSTWKQLSPKIPTDVTAGKTRD
jgi:5-hydroxyisourate hydrolase-like protein (transthyretin family)/protocatechuate 3,4-dioxygenase beta subunit